MFYPRADADVCTAALLLEIEAIGLVRGRRDGGFALAQYVNAVEAVLIAWRRSVVIVGR